MNGQKYDEETEMKTIYVASKFSSNMSDNSEHHGRNIGEKVDDDNFDDEPQNNANFNNNALVQENESISAINDRGNSSAAMNREDCSQTIKDDKECCGNSLTEENHCITDNEYMESATGSSSVGVKNEILVNNIAKDADDDIEIHEGNLKSKSQIACTVSEEVMGENLQNTSQNTQPNNRHVLHPTKAIYATNAKGDKKRDCPMFTKANANRKFASTLVKESRMFSNKITSKLTKNEILYLSSEKPPKKVVQKKMSNNNYASKIYKNSLSQKIFKGSESLKYSSKTLRSTPKKNYNFNIPYKMTTSNFTSSKNPHSTTDYEISNAKHETGNQENIVVCTDHHKVDVDNYDNDGRVTGSAMTITATATTQLIKRFDNRSTLASIKTVPTSEEHDNNERLTTVEETSNNCSKSNKLIKIVQDSVREFEDVRQSIFHLQHLRRIELYSLHQLVFPRQRSARKINDVNSLFYNSTNLTSTYSARRTTTTNACFSEG